MAKRIFVAGSCRTSIGRGPKAGALSDILAADLLTICLKESLNRVKPNALDAVNLDEVIVGQVAQSSDAPNIARVAALKAGIPESVPAFTVQRNCGSGLQALVSAAQMIKAGDARKDCFLVGGTESMSNIVHVLRGLRKGLNYDPRRLLNNFVDGLAEGLTDPITGEAMGQTAENIAEKYGISREDQDEFAVQSHQKAFRATRSGKYRSQIVPVTTRKKEIVSQDEGINPAISRAVLAMYPTIFKENGTVTPGNSCQISDGAASLLVFSDLSPRNKIDPEAEVVSYAFAACSPSYMGMGPSLAIPAALARAGLSIDDIDIFEINEAFAAQALACQRELKIPMEKLNPWGGAIALGHPVGATGAILIVKAIAMLKDMKKQYAVISMCIGGGQGGAAVIKNLS